MTAPRVRAWFSVLGFTGDPDQISVMMGTAPDDAWRAGEGIGPARTPQPEAGWRIRSRLPSDADVEEHARGLLDRLPSRLPADERSSGLYLQLSCAVDVYDERPALSFSPETIARIAALGAAIDVDLYGLSHPAG
jgi:hypothetical protein